MLTVQQRLGQVLGLLGRYDEAKQMLHDVAPALRECWLAAVRAGRGSGQGRVGCRTGRLRFKAWVRSTQHLNTVAFPPHPPSPPAGANLGEGNPASEELEFVLALIGLREMEGDGVTDPARRAQHLAAMEVRLHGAAAAAGAARHG